MAYPPFYSFYHQPGVINFTHLCSPSPHLHYQDLIPPLPYSQPQPLDPSATVKSLLHQILHSQQTLQQTLSAFATDVSNLSTKLTPTTFTHTSVTFPFVTPISSLNPQPPINNPLSSHIPYQELLPLAALCLNTDSEPLLSPPTLKDETETGKPKELAASGGNSSTTANGRSQEITAAKEKGLEAEPHTIPPPDSLCNMFLDSSVKDEEGAVQVLIAEGNVVSTNNFIGLRFDDLSIFTSTDLVRLSFSAKFVSKHNLSSSATKLERAVVIFVFETENTTAKMIGNTIFVFDPGGIFSFYEFSSATVTISATPLHRSSFVFDPGGIKSDVCRHLSNQTFQKALSSSSVSISVTSSSFSTMVLFFNVSLPTNLVLLDTACTPDFTDLTITPQPREGDRELALAAAIDAVPSHAIAPRSGSASGNDWESLLGFARNGERIVDGRTQGMGLLNWAS